MHGSARNLFFNTNKIQLKTF